jgi:D-glycero-D-manno-heptose 1,7-bisphosphate phosphatase
MQKRGVFLDRDGVINRNVWYESSGEWESPRTAADVVLHDGAATAISKLNASGFPVFIVSNQPSYAKGKTTLEDLEQVDLEIINHLQKQGAKITERFYAYDHPHSIVADVPGPKGARKPSPLFLIEAAQKYSIDLSRSWMVGDRDSDIECGLRAGVKTIHITPDHPDSKSGAMMPDYRAHTLLEAVTSIILPPYGGETAFQE